MRSKMRILSALVCASAALSAFDVSAKEAFPRWYIGLAAGGTLMHDFDGEETYSSVSTGDLSASGTQSMDPGYSYGGQLGYVLPWFSGVRLEGEIVVLQNDVSSGFAVSGIIDDAVEIKRTAYMLNMLYDFAPDSAWSPYIGMGGGVSSIDFGFGNDKVLAGQILTGINFYPASMPNTIWSLGYRAILQDGVDMNGSSVNSIFEAVHETGEYSASVTHSAELGLKMRF